MSKYFFLLTNTVKLYHPAPVYFLGFTQSGLSVGYFKDRAIKFASKDEALNFATRNGLVEWEPVEVKFDA